MPLSVEDADFEAEVLRAAGSVLVRFWAEWSGPCRQLAPTLLELAVEFQDRLRIVMVDIERNSETRRMYDVRGIPTLVLFRGGQVVARRHGALPKAAVAGWLEEQLARDA